ncbi:hypothetical protein IFM89_020691 [Coptis chinensis]|uniref:Uncharacterized protein n=1 Tax=Coptis chinensis TaxID=261450 RepID=A0A835I5T1_9MAGN|nr:hypothetical protein IFM89_020691 [Coptis chinensis]
MAVSSTTTPCDELQGQDSYNISVVSENEIADPLYPAYLNFQATPKPVENPTCKDPQWDCKNCTVLQIGVVDRYSPCNVDTDSKKESLDEPDNDGIGSLKRVEGSLYRMFHRKLSLLIGEKIMQLLMNHSIMLLKCTSGDKPVAERAPDTPNSRWRRYKRAASLDSRKVVLLFSILSSLGTLVLIYLTLRVKQMDDELGRAE